MYSFDQAISTTLEQRLLEEDTSAIDISSCLNVVKSIGDTVQVLPEVLVENVLGLGTNTFLHRNHVAFKVRIHSLDSESGTVTLHLANIVGTEEKLSQTDHGPVLEHLTTNGAGTNKELLHIGNLVLVFGTENGDLSIISAASGLAKFSRSLSGCRQGLKRIKIHPLVNRLELARNSLEGLLCHKSAKIGSHGVEITLGLVTQFLQKLLVKLDLKTLLLGELLGSTQYYDSIIVIHGVRESLVRKLESVERLETEMELLRSIKLGKIRDKELGLLERCGEILEVDDLGHLDLCIHTTSLVLAESRHIANREGVRSLNFDLSGFGSIKSVHSFDFRECHVVAVFQAVSSFVKGGHQALLIDACHDASKWGLASRINNSKLLAEVTEDRAEKTKCVSHNNIDTLAMAVVADGLLLVDGRVGQNHNLILVELREVAVKTRGLVKLNGSVGIQLSDTRDSDLISRLSDIFGGKEELGREGNILGDFYTEALEANDEDVGGAHALHGLVAEDIELSAVE
ncbi:hypothetical protein HG530_010079 [Fusarium avenaceum]|nr:hypothetical protein HG530_010079 [Fusarium avenaceum]